jgi:hypothetical protein
MADGDESVVAFLQTASDYYDQVSFNSDALYNQEAPAYWVSFSIGGVRISLLFCSLEIHQ